MEEITQTLSVFERRIKMKLQVFLYGEFGYAQKIADEISEKFHCKCDQIPPAYQCNEEKLVFIVYEMYGSLSAKLTSYLRSTYSPSRLHNCRFSKHCSTPKTKKSC